jgi:hypothetical protein
MSDEALDGPPRGSAEEFHKVAIDITQGRIPDPQSLSGLLCGFYDQLIPADVSAVVTTAVTNPALIGYAGQFALNCRDHDPEAAKAAFLALLNSPPPPAADARLFWLASANNALIVTHAAGWFGLSAQLADQVVPYFAENPHLTHAAACSYVAVGRLDDAMTQVRLAVELGYPHLDKLAVDTDLAPLFEREDFRALFASPDEPDRGCRQVRFPNSFGFVSPSGDLVSELQQRHGFSDAYAAFLTTQNGWNAVQHAEHPLDTVPSPSATSEGHPDLKFLFALQAGSDDINLALELQLDDPLLAVFFPIGVSYGGDLYVEVLRGQDVGRIGSIDAGLAMEIISTYDRVADAADILTDPETGVLWKHAANFNDFLTCIHLDKSGCGFVIDPEPSPATA